MVLCGILEEVIHAQESAKRVRNKLAVLPIYGPYPTKYLRPYILTTPQFSKNISVFLSDSIMFMSLGRLFKFRDLVTGISRDVDNKIASIPRDAAGWSA